METICEILENINDKSSILDFGCGEGYLKKIYYKKDHKHNIINYDIISEKSEVKDYKNLNYDLIVASHVFCLFSEKNLCDFLQNEINKNKDIKFIVAIGKQSLVSKIAQFITNKRSSNSYNQLSGAEELEIISRYKKLVYKKNILFMTDVCYFI
jgi:cyclopropane fatty-acyl-phospholipid synthase-like methyltransferase